MSGLVLNLGFNYAPLTLQCAHGLYAVEGPSCKFAPLGIGLFNPMWVNYAAGGGSSLEYEAFPLMRNRVFEGRGPTTGINNVLCSLGPSNGPIVDFSMLLYTGDTLTPTHVGAQTWFYTGSAYRSFNCGFTGNGTEAVSGVNATISGLTRSGNNTTFVMTPNGVDYFFGYSVSGVTVEVLDQFAYLPDYPTGPTSLDVLDASQFTTEAINFWKNFGGIRWMFWENAWFNSVTNTAATMNTFANTKYRRGWGGSPGQPLFTEGYPLDVAAFFCRTCGIGGWFHIPIGADATYVTKMANILYAYMPIGQPIRIEIGNELWNGGAGVTLQSNAITAGYSGPLAYMSLLGDLMVAWGAIFKSVFGPRFGTDLQMVVMSQQGQGVSFINSMIQNMLAKSQVPNQSVHYLGMAPYIMCYPLTNGGAPFSLTSTVAQIEANLAGTDGANSPYAANSVANANCKLESLLSLAKFYGMQGILTYEGCWQTNAENTGLVNAGAAIMDSGMTAVEEALYQNCANSGVTAFTRFEGGVSAKGVAALGPVDQLDWNFNNLITNGSPRSLAQAHFFNGIVGAKNVVSGPGSTFDARNYADYQGSTYPTLTQFGNTPVGAFNGNFAYLVTCTKAGTYHLAVGYSNSTGTALQTNIIIDGVTVITGAVVNNGVAPYTNVSVPLGVVTLTKGYHVLIIGNSTFRSDVTLGPSFTWT